MRERLRADVRHSASPLSAADAGVDSAHALRFKARVSERDARRGPAGRERSPARAIVRRRAPLARRHGLATLALALVLALAARAARAEDAAAKPASPAPEAATLEVASAKWESGYGVKFFQVVGSVRNAGDRPLGAVQVHAELLDAAGAVVAEVDCWNGRAEALGDLRGEAARAKLASAKIEPIAPGATDRWRCTFLEEDAPQFVRHRARVAAALPAP